MDFDNQKVYRDTSITDGLVFIMIMRTGHCQNILGLTVVLLASRLGQELDTGSSLSPGSQRTGAGGEGLFSSNF